MRTTWMFGCGISVLLLAGCGPAGQERTAELSTPAVPPGAWPAEASGTAPERRGIYFQQIPVRYSGDPAKDVPADGEGKEGKGGAQLWSENCARCHNLKPATMYNDDEWEVVVDHMRGRARLTAHEARKITEFLQAGN